ncbi:hypothetical protein [Novacetimonas hansenii]|uniref:hypothetical protein n=1 Tax=Novacetimonas hansenii TaxID=436 RepID=UPI000791DE6C|nr:hypothetical protein [Novacetimonas hansenii]WEQ58306.1 hypothetical protein LV563_10615 [Novacetimonas hansenii]CUW48551.1 hypothetical protein ATCC53582_02690 [Novacetimonas hansenii]
MFPKDQNGIPLNFEEIKDSCDSPVTPHITFVYKKDGNFIADYPVNPKNWIAFHNIGDADNFNRVFVYKGPDPMNLWYKIKRTLSDTSS